jgi:hypothetical protein
MWTHRVQVKLLYNIKYHYHHRPHVYLSMSMNVRPWFSIIGMKQWSWHKAGWKKKEPKKFTRKIP